jgi:hypothetical protein
MYVSSGFEILASGDEASKGAKRAKRTCRRSSSLGAGAGIVCVLHTSVNRNGDRAGPAVLHVGFKMIPGGFFSRNPALDVPK